MSSATRKVKWAARQSSCGARVKERVPTLEKMWSRVVAACAVAVAYAKTVDYEANGAKPDDDSLTTEVFHGVILN